MTKKRTRLGDTVQMQRKIQRGRGCEGKRWLHVSLSTVHIPSLLSTGFGKFNAKRRPTAGVIHKQSSARASTKTDEYKQEL